MGRWKSGCGEKLLKKCMIPKTLKFLKAGSSILLKIKDKQISLKWEETLGTYWIIPPSLRC